MINDENLEPKDQQPTVKAQSAPKSPSSMGKEQMKLAGLIAIIVIVLGGLWYWHNHRQQPQNYSFTYQATEPYTVPGNAAGSGLTFNKPNAFPPVAPNEDSKNTRGFEQLMANNKAKTLVVVSRLIANSTDRTAVSTAFLKAVNSAMATPSSSNTSDYANVVRNAQNFARQAFPQVGRQISFGNAQPFTDSYVTANAWKFGLTFTQPSGITPNQQGELVYLIGKHTVYYFLITAIDSNWSSNSQFFQQKVLNSIKIDQ